MIKLLLYFLPFLSLFLPNIWNCHNGFKFSRQEYPAPVLKNNYITFGSFNNFNKINSSVVKIWSNILKKIPNSKLIIKSPTKKDIDYLIDALETIAG